MREMNEKLVRPKTCTIRKTDLGRRKLTGPGPIKEVVSHEQRLKEETSVNGTEVWFSPRDNVRGRREICM